MLPLLRPRLLLLLFLLFSLLPQERRRRPPRNDMKCKLRHTLRRQLTLDATIVHSQTSYRLNLEVFLGASQSQAHLAMQSEMKSKMQLLHLLPLLLLPRRYSPFLIMLLRYIPLPPLLLLLLSWSLLRLSCLHNLGQAQQILVSEYTLRSGDLLRLLFWKKRLTLIDHYHHRDLIML